MFFFFDFESSQSRISALDLVSSETRYFPKRKRKKEKKKSESPTNQIQPAKKRHSQERWRHTTTLLRVAEASSVEETHTGGRNKSANQLWSRAAAVITSARYPDSLDWTVHRSIRVSSSLPSTPPPLHPPPSPLPLGGSPVFLEDTGEQPLSFPLVPRPTPFPLVLSSML